MVEVTIFTGMMQPGERQTVRAEWGGFVRHHPEAVTFHAIPDAGGLYSHNPDIESFSPDETGVTITLACHVAAAGRAILARLHSTIEQQ